MPVTKEEILAEIRRTATSNDGVPLGSRKFEVETGIRPASWKGKLWARWSDAVREAGFTPNVPTPAYDDAWLLARLAQLVRELRRIPADGDLRLKARTDPSFPSTSTYERFGTKRDLVDRLLGHCAAEPSLADVVAIARGARVRERIVAAPEDTAVSPGVVYLLKAGRHYKIGRTKSTIRRERELAIQLPERATLVHEIRTDDAPGIEAYWHRRFADRRKNGEWFALSASDVAAFRRRKFM